MWQQTIHSKKICTKWLTRHASGYIDCYGDCHCKPDVYCYRLTHGPMAKNSLGNRPTSERLPFRKEMSDMSYLWNVIGYFAISACCLTDRAIRKCYWQNMRHFYAIIIQYCFNITKETLLHYYWRNARHFKIDNVMWMTDVLSIVFSFLKSMSEGMAASVGSGLDYERESLTGNVQYSLG